MREPAADYRFNVSKPEKAASKESRKGYRAAELILILGFVAFLSWIWFDSGHRAGQYSVGYERGYKSAVIDIHFEGVEACLEKTGLKPAQ